MTFLEHVRNWLVLFHTPRPPERPHMSDWERYHEDMAIRRIRANARHGRSEKPLGKTRVGIDPRRNGDA